MRLKRYQKVLSSQALKCGQESGQSLDIAPSDIFGKKTTAGEKTKSWVIPWMNIPVNVIVFTGKKKK